MIAWFWALLELCGCNFWNNLGPVKETNVHIYVRSLGALWTLDSLLVDQTKDCVSTCIVLQGREGANTFPPLSGNLFIQRDKLCKVKD